MMVPNLLGMRAPAQIIFSLDSGLDQANHGSAFKNLRRTFRSVEEVAKS